ncbi:MAG: hypothetical protein AAF577_01250 [Pseudomonadota bacterium]
MPAIKTPAAVLLSLLLPVAAAQAGPTATPGERSPARTAVDAFNAEQDRAAADVDCRQASGGERIAKKHRRVVDASQGQGPINAIVKERVDDCP